MKLLQTTWKQCPCCMEEHEVQTIQVVESNVFKGVPVKYDAEYCYCSRADETYAEEQQLSRNYGAMKNAYDKECESNG